MERVGNPKSEKLFEEGLTAPPRDQTLTAEEMFFRVLDPASSNEDFKVFCSQLDALAFLPPDKVNEGFDILRADVPDGAEALTDYVSNVYVNGTFRRAQALPADDQAAVRIWRTPPRFPPEIWNVHAATINDEPRTNNMCEGFNNRFLQLVGHKRPNIWKFIKSIKEEESAVRSVIQQDSIGDPPRKRQKRVYVQLQSRLKALCNDVAFDTKTIQEFFRCIAHNLRWAPVNREARDNDD